MSSIQFGFILPSQFSGKERQPAFLETMHRALALASGFFDAFYAIDHLMPEDLESFTTLAYLAGLYPQLKFGHTVVCQSFRSPALVAKMGATLQFLSGGRFVLGIGAGWHEQEYRAFGYDFPPAGVRVEQLEEAVQIIQSLWSGQPTTFAGKYYRVTEAVCAPVPNPRPPIMIGAFKPKMLRITAQYADEWNVSSTSPQRYRRLLAEFERACAEVRRDPFTVRRSWGGGCICAPTPAEVERLAGERNSDYDDPDDFDFIGTPREVIEQMQAFIDLGITSFMMDCGGFPNLTTLDMLVNEVLPEVKKR